MENNNNNNNNNNNDNNAQLICNGELKIVKITEDLYGQAVELFVNYFMKYENVSIAANLTGSAQTRKEMELLIRGSMKDGISFAVMTCDTNEMVSLAVNVIIRQGKPGSLDAVFAQFRSNEMKEVCEYLERMENTFDIFKEWNIATIMEILFLSTRLDYGGKGISTILSQYSIDYARQMLNGTLPASELAALPPHVQDAKPQAVTSTFSSRFTQRIGEKLNFQILNKVPHSEVVFAGKAMSEKIEPIHEFSIYEGLRL